MSFTRPTSLFIRKQQSWREGLGRRLIPSLSLSAHPQEMVHNELPVEELGFSSVGELLRSVHGVMVVRLEGAGPIMVFLSEDVGGNGTRREDNGVAGMDENTACKEVWYV